MNERSPDADLLATADVALERAGATGPFRVERVPVGASNAVFRAVDARGRVHAVRIAARRSRHAVEMAAMRAATAAGVPVPTLRFAGEVEVGDRAHAVMVLEWIEGVRLADATLDATERAALLDQAATILARIHQIEVAGYGNLDAQLASPWRDFAAWFTDAGRDDLATSCALAGTSAPELARLLERATAVLEAARGSLTTDRPKMAHGDFSPNNLIVAGTQLVAVLDWESVKGGPPALDFGWWDFIGGGAVLPTGDLLDAYRQVTGLALDHLDEERRLVHIRILCGHVAWSVRTSTTVATEPLAADLARLLAPPDP